ILARAGRLEARHPVDGEPLEAGRIYVAPPDHHLLVGRDRVRVVRGPQENGHRPAVDPLFRSASSAFGPRVVAVVLTGTLDDGAAGSAAVSKHGGRLIVQDPADAPFPSMPLYAIAADHPEDVLPVEAIAGAITRLVDEL